MPPLSEIVHDYFPKPFLINRKKGFGSKANKNDDGLPDPFRVLRHFDEKRFRRFSFFFRFRISLFCRFDWNRLTCFWPSQTPKMGAIVTLNNNSLKTTFFNSFLSYYFLL
jgi:hypothetical protein